MLGLGGEMTIPEITEESVLKAIAEFDKIGRTEFLAKYGFKKALDFFVIHKGRYYDSKALAGAAHGYLGRSKNPLPKEVFSGGEASVRAFLQDKLGFVMTGKDTKPFIGAAPGEVLSNAEVSRRFKVGNMGGMRRNKAARHLMLISDPFKGLYQDRWKGKVLHYTGEGKKGDQPLTKQNKNLFHSRTSGEVIHLFEVIEPKEYTYVGEVELITDPYQETQPDDDGKPRSVWMFPIKAKEGGYLPTPTQQQVDKVEKKKERKVSRLSDEELEKRAKAAKGKPSKRTVTNEQIARDPTVVEYVKRMADGNCDLCREPAPFITKKKVPYLECHHIKQLAKDGEDAISNAVALCPNCHRKMHSLNDKKDIAALKRRVAERD